MLGKVFKAYDIRGTYPDPLNEQMAWQIGFGAAKFLLADAATAGEGSPMMRNVVVGRDMRKSSPSLSQSLIAGMRDFGANVIDVGMVDTSFIYFAVNHLDCAGGVMTTASHNPPQYNGFKTSKRKAKPVGESSGLADIRKFAATADKATVVPAGGKLEQRDLWSAYARHVLSFLDLPKGRKLRVVVDASNGMAGVAVPKVFGKKGSAVPGLDIIELNFDTSKGEFAHDPNPLVAANLAQLQAAVRAEKADLGVCFDGDADRCVIVDDKASIVGGDILTAVMAKHFLKKTPASAVVYDLRSTKAVAEDVTKAGGVPVRSRVGHVFMKAALAERSAVFGGELSGHMYFRDNFCADSGLIAMAVTLTIVANSSKRMSELTSPVCRYVQSGEINFHIEDKDGAIAALKKSFAVPGSVDELDGVTIDRFDAEGWWCNVRKSNTEPLLRLNLEVRKKDQLAPMLARISPLLGQKVDH